MVTSTYLPLKGHLKRQLCIVLPASKLFFQFLKLTFLQHFFSIIIWPAKYLSEKHDVS